MLTLEKSDRHRNVPDEGPDAFFTRISFESLDASRELLFTCPHANHTTEKKNPIHCLLNKCLRMISQRSNSEAASPEWRLYSTNNYGMQSGMLKEGALLTGRLIIGHISTDLGATVYTGPLIDNWMSGSRHRCLKLAKTNRTFCVLEDASPDILLLGEIKLLK